MVTSAQITDALARWHKWNPRTQVMIPNASWGVGISEADLLVVSQSRWCQEVEIKVSMADYRREFVTKAEKHKRLVEGETKVDYVFNGPGQKYTRTEKPHQPQIIKHFWFAMPEDLALKVLESGTLPDHAGLLAVPEKCGYAARVKVLKDAPRLRYSRAMTTEEYTSALRLGYLRYWSIRHKEAA